MCEHVGGPKNYGHVAASHPRNTLLLRMCYTELCRSMSNRLGEGRGFHKFWGRWDPAPWNRGVADPFGNTLLYHFTCLIVPNVVIVGQTTQA